jgi:hypothetical protein
MLDLELSREKMIFKAHETEMKITIFRQGETHARVGANYTENDLQDTCV